MDLVQFFLPHHESMYTVIADRFSPLTDDQMRLRPHPHMHSIAWLLWHIARCEDIGVNRLIANRPDVLDGEEWWRRLNLSRRDMGTGMTDEEVTKFSARVNTAALREYSAAVGRRTREIVRGLRAEELDEVPDPAHVRRVLSDIHPYIGKTKGWLLIHVALRHPSGHLGQATLVRKMQGLGSGGP